jgi:hypothetical protein
MNESNMFDTSPQQEEDVLLQTQGGHVRRKAKSVSPSYESDSTEGLDSASKRRKVTPTMDQVLPELCKRIMSWGNLRIGRGCDPFANCNGGETRMGCFVLIERHGEAGVECPVAFMDLDELVYALDKGITEQQSEDGHRFTTFCKYREADGKITKEKKTIESIGITLNVRPRSDRAEEELEWVEELHFGDSSEKREVIKRMYTSGLNFSLASSFDLSGAKTNFSFKMQFPKCARWLTYPMFSGKNLYYWFKVESGGILKAMRGKSDIKKGSGTVMYKTSTCSSVHEMFTAMENMIILPKQWK